MSSDGFTTKGQPAASAGATWCTIRFSGWLKALTATTTPMGSCCVNATRPADAALMSIGIARPASVRSRSTQRAHPVDGAPDLDAGIDERLPAFPGGLHASSSARVLHQRGGAAAGSRCAARAEATGSDRGTPRGRSPRAVSIVARSARSTDPSRAPSQGEWTVFTAPVARAPAPSSGSVRSSSPLQSARRAASAQTGGTIEDVYLGASRFRRETDPERGRPSVSTCSLIRWKNHSCQR